MTITQKRISSATTIMPSFTKTMMPMNSTLLQQQQHRYNNYPPNNQRCNSYHSSSISSLPPETAAAATTTTTTEEATTSTNRINEIQEITKAKKTLYSSDDSPYQKLLEELKSARDQHDQLFSSSSSSFDKTEIAKSHVKIGKLHYDLGQLLEAQDAYESALHLLLENNGKDCEMVASTMHVLGSIHVRLGDVVEAQKWYEGSLDMKRRLYLVSGGNDEKEVLHHPEIGKGLNGLAMCLIQHHSTKENEEEDEEAWEEEAIKLFEKAMQQYILYQPPPTSSQPQNDDPTENNHKSEKDYDDDDDEMLNNPNHPTNHYDVSNININIALLLRQMERHYQALEHYREALRIRLLHAEFKQEEEDESIIGLYIDIGDCEMFVEEYMNAKRSYEDALRLHLEMREKKDGGGVDSQYDKEEGKKDDDDNDDDEKEEEKSTKYVSFHDDEEDEKYERMEQEKRRREEEQEKIKRSTSVEGIIHHNLGRIYAQEGNHEKALSEYKQCLAIQKHIGGESHVQVAQTLNCMGAVYGAEGDLYQAMTCFKEALFIFRLNSDCAEEEEDLDIVNVKRNIEMVQASLNLKKMSDGGADKLDW